MIDETPGRPVASSPAEVGLRPSMHGFGALLITVSCLSPSIGVFIVGSDVIKQAGTGVFVCFAAAAVLGVMMADVYGELASAFPGAGGEYTILGRALGPGWGVATLALNLTGFCIAQSLSGLGTARYLEAALPGLGPGPLIAAGLVVLTTVVGVLNIRIGAAVTGAFLAVELLALALVAVLGFGHPHRGLVEAALTPRTLAPGGGLASASVAVIGAATAAGVYAFNGYGAVVFLGEELHEAPRRIARVVFLALAVAAVTELGPVLAILVGAPDLRALLAAKAPISAFVAALGGPGLARLMSLGVAAAIFNAMIAVALMAGRQLYSTGRDRLWPPRISRALARVHPSSGAPWVATLVMGAAALAGCFVSEELLLIALGNGNLVLYAGLCAATLAGRRSGATGHAGFRMPLYPAPVTLAIVGVAAMAGFSLSDPAGREGLGVSALVTGAGGLYWALVLRRRPAASEAQRGGAASS